MRPLGFEPRTCGLRVPQRLVQLVLVCPLTWSFVRQTVHRVVLSPVYYEQLGTKLGTKIRARLDVSPMIINGREFESRGDNVLLGKSRPGTPVKVRR